MRAIFQFLKMQIMEYLNADSTLAKVFEGEYKTLTDNYIKELLAQNEKLWIACTKILTKPDHYTGITIDKQDYIKSAETLISLIDSSTEHQHRLIALSDRLTNQIPYPITHLTEAARMELLEITTILRSFNASFSMLYDRYSGIYAGATHENRVKENKDNSKFNRIVFEIHSFDNYTEASSDDMMYLVSFLELSSANNDDKIAIFSNLFQCKNLIYPLRHLTDEGRKKIENILKS